MDRICICGGGALGHVIASWISGHHHVRVNILTNHPEKWEHHIVVDTPDGEVLQGEIDLISNDANEVIPSSHVVLLCLPGFLIKEELERIKPYLDSDTYVGSVFSSTGFFFEAQKILDETQPLWGFQRVPFISRVQEYGNQLICWGSSLLIILQSNMLQKKKR